MKLLRLLLDCPDCGPLPLTSILGCVDSGVGLSSKLFLHCRVFRIWFELLRFCVFDNDNGCSKSGFVVPESSMFQLLLCDCECDSVDDLNSFVVSAGRIVVPPVRL